HRSRWGGSAPPPSPSAARWVGWLEVRPAHRPDSFRSSRPTNLAGALRTGNRSAVGSQERRQDVWVAGQGLGILEREDVGEVAPSLVDVQPVADDEAVGAVEAPVTHLEGRDANDGAV